MRTILIRFTYDSWLPVTATQVRMLIIHANVTDA